jgi:hypothetical protein
MEDLVNGDFHSVDVKLPPGTSPQHVFEIFAGDPNRIGNRTFDRIEDFELRGNGPPMRGSIYDIDILGPDNGSVMVTEVELGPERGYVSVATIVTEKFGMHPENGTRTFGYFSQPGGVTTFYTQGHSLGSTCFHELGKPVQDLGWQGLMQGFGEFAVRVGGEAMPPTQDYWEEPR